MHRSAKFKQGRHVLIHAATGASVPRQCSWPPRCLELHGTCSPQRGASVSDVGSVPINLDYRTPGPAGVLRTLAGNYQLFRYYPQLVTRQNRLRFFYLSQKLGRLLLPGRDRRHTSTGIDVVFHGIRGPGMWRSRLALCAGGNVVVDRVTSSVNEGPLSGRRTRSKCMAGRAAYVAGS